MEADWSVEIGADLPTIVVPWEGFVDLRRDPLLATGLNETAKSPSLAQALIKLNQETSPVFTSKCDLWLLSADEIDPLEFDAEKVDAQQGVACYIDIIARSLALFASFPAHEVWARSATERMRGIRMPQTHTELVVRPSIVNGRDGYALTLYVASCGATEGIAQSVFRAALKAVSTITMDLAATVGE